MITPIGLLKELYCEVIKDNLSLSSHVDEVMVNSHYKVDSVHFIIDFSTMSIIDFGNLNDICASIEEYYQRKYNVPVAAYCYPPSNWGPHNLGRFCMFLPLHLFTPYNNYMKLKNRHRNITRQMEDITELA